MGRSWDEKPSSPNPVPFKGNCHLGLVIIDSHLNQIAFNREAATILSNPVRPVTAPGRLHIPEEISDRIRNRDANGGACLVTEFRCGDKKYVCRSYPLMQSDSGYTAEHLLALILERRFPFSDAVDELASRYRLTQREHETLSGLAEGLSGKELAQRMQISPNTVKAFMRLIMVKMGVDSRAAIAAKVFETTNAGGPS